MGRSARGIAVSTTLVSPRAEGLFQRAIIASGATPENAQAPVRAARTAATLAAELGVSHPVWQ